MYKYGDFVTHNYRGETVTDKILFTFVVVILTTIVIYDQARSAGVLIPDEYQHTYNAMIENLNGFEGECKRNGPHGHFASYLETRDNLRDQLLRDTDWGAGEALLRGVAWGTHYDNWICGGDGVFINVFR